MSTRSAAKAERVLTAEGETDGDEALVKAASRLDKPSFDELFARHSDAAWRLAEAVGPASSAAREAVAEGFSQVLRGVRRRRFATDAQFRPMLLAEVYRGAIIQSRQAKAAALPNGTPVERPADSPLENAFRCLPERWRAALWLSEVETIAPGALAVVLGVSIPVGMQLVERGHEGLITRLNQAGIALPSRLGDDLGAMATPLPGGVDSLAFGRWKASAETERPSAGARGLSALLGGEGSTRPLWIASGTLVVLGMIGLGVMTVASSPTPSGPIAAISAPPLAGDFALKPSNGAGSKSANSATNQAAKTTAGGISGAAVAATSSTTTPAGGSQNGGSGAGSGSSTTPGGSSKTIPPSVSPRTNSLVTAPTTPSTPTTTSPTTPTSPPTSNTILDVAGLATVTQPASGGLGVAVGSPAAPILGVTLSPTCTGLQLLNLITDTCANPQAPSVVGTLLTSLGL